jgi:hypothetical protein
MDVEAHRAPVKRSSTLGPRHHARSYTKSKWRPYCTDILLAPGSTQIVLGARKSLKTCASININQVFAVFSALSFIFCIARDFLRLSFSGVYAK